MDATKKRKAGENGVVDLTVEDARKILEPFTRDQLLEILLEATVNHADVLDAVRVVADRDVTQRKLFIRGLGWDTTTDGLRTIFSAYGQLEEAVVILDKATGKSKGYGFIRFKHIDGAINALKEPSKMIDGHQLLCKLAIDGKKGKPGAGGVPDGMPEMPPSGLGASTAVHGNPGGVPYGGQRATVGWAPLRANRLRVGTLDRLRHLLVADMVLGWSPVFMAVRNTAG